MIQVSVAAVHPVYYSVQLSLFQGRKTAKNAVRFAEQKEHIQLICGQNDYHGLIAKFSIILYLKTVDHQKCFW
jgi:hypothetical protein